MNATLTKLRADNTKLNQQNRAAAASGPAQQRLVSELEALKVQLAAEQEERAAYQVDAEIYRRWMWFQECGCRIGESVDLVPVAGLTLGWVP